jgi:hypothetical protein
MSDSTEYENNELNYDDEYDYEEDARDILENIDIQMSKSIENIFNYAEKKSFISLGNFPKIVEVYKTILEDNLEEVKTGADDIGMILNIFDPIYKKIVRIAEMIEDEYIKKEMEHIFFIVDPHNHKSLDMRFVHEFYGNMYQFYKGFYSLFVEKGIIE